MKKIAIMNQKGGVGKTTSAANIGEGLSLLGKRVLLLDLDPQANLTYSLGIAAHQLDRSIYHLLKNAGNPESIMVKRNGVDVLPSSLELSGAEIEFSSIPGREFLLAESMQNFREYDFAIIDCPPSLGLLTLNALTTADQVWIPLQTEFLPMQGIVKLLQTIDVVKRRLNQSLEISGIICTRYDKRKNLNKEVVEKIKEHFQAKVFQTIIRENISLAEAPGFGKTIFEYKPNSFGAKDYHDLCCEIIARIENGQGKTIGF